MKRLVIALCAAALFSSPALAVTQVQRQMNDFDAVSQPKYAPRPHHDAADEHTPGHSGYNKAIEEHKLRMEAEEEKHAKPGKKAVHHKKHAPKPKHDKPAAQ